MFMGALLVLVSYKSEEIDVNNTAHHLVQDRAWGVSGCLFAFVYWVLYRLPHRLSLHTSNCRHNKRRSANMAFPVRNPLYVLVTAAPNALRRPRS